MYESLLAEVDPGTNGLSLEQQSALYVTLRDTRADENLGEWLDRVDRELKLRAALSATGMRPEDDLEELTSLLEKCLQGEYQDHRVQDFAADGRGRGKVVVTTLHGSKGRQFDAVVLPGLVEGLFPRHTWSRTHRRLEEPTASALREARRLFYVGFTRARRSVYLIYSNGYVNRNGFLNRLGPSRFAREIADRLKTGI